MISFCANTRRCGRWRVWCEVLRTWEEMEMPPWGGVNVLLLMRGALLGKPNKPRPGQGQDSKERLLEGGRVRLPPPSSLPVFIHSHLTVYFLLVRPVGSDFPTTLPQLRSAQCLLQCKSKVPLYDIWSLPGQALAGLKLCLSWYLVFLPSQTNYSFPKCTT